MRLRADTQGHAQRITRGEEELKEEEEEDNVPVGIVGEKATYNVTAIDHSKSATLSGTTKSRNIPNKPLALRTQKWSMDWRRARNLNKFDQIERPREAEDELDWAKEEEEDTRREP